MASFDEWQKQKGLGFAVGERPKTEIDLAPEKQDGSNIPLGNAEGMFESAKWAIPQLIGIEPPKKVREFQQESPWLALAAEVPAFAVPYLGAARLFTLARLAAGLSKVSPKAGGAITKLASPAALAEAPIKTGAARMIVQFAPMEAGRVAIAAAAGEEIAGELGTEFRGTGDVAIQAGADLILGGALGGVFSGLASAGKRDILTRPSQIELRRMETQRTDIPQAELPMFEAKINKLRAQVRGEVIRKGRYVGDLGEGILTKGLNRLFKPKISPGLERKILNRGASPIFFKDEKLRDNIMAQAGIAGKEAWMQTPRHIRSRTVKNDKVLEGILTKSLESIDSTQGWFMRQERGTGQFVMGKRISRGEWVIFKTDSPGQFLPEHEVWKKTMEGKGAVFGPVGAPVRALSAQKGASTEVYDNVARFKQDVPVFDYRDLDVRKGKVNELAEKILKRTNLGGDSELATRAGGFIRNTLAPAMFQFTNSPTAGHIFSAAKVARDSAEAVAERMYLGARTLGKAKTPLGAIYKGAQPGEGGIKALVDTLAKDKAQWSAWQRAVIRGLSPKEAVEELDLGEAGLSLLKRLGEVDAWQLEGMNKIRAATGEGAVIGKANHYMISRFWKGDWRVPIREGHNVVGYASGKNKPAAIREAKLIEEEAAAEGQSWVAGLAHTKGDGVDSEIKLLAKLGDQDARSFGKIWERVAIGRGQPTRLKEKRTGAKFFTGDREIWTKDQVEKAILKQLRDYQLHNAQLSIKALYQEEIQALAMSDAVTAEALANRIGLIFGEQGGFSKTINKVADSVLSPLLGQNSASKITNTANKYLFQWTLGFVNTGYNVANALTFVQTAFPHLSFLTTAAPERLAKYYTYWPVDSGKSMEAVGMLDMMKLTKQSFRELGKPSETLLKHFTRGAEEGVWDPKFVEAFVGESTERIKLKNILNGSEPFSNWLEGAATWAPGLTEKFSRGQAFSMGHIFFRDMMGITDDEMLYQLTKQFVEKTQFLYSTGDRAKVITGPLGSSFGLFKNWVMHQMGWMAEYTGEAVLRGNWKPLGWTLGSTTAVGGLGALPFYGAADEMQKHFSDKSLMLQTYEMFGEENQKAADTAFYGFPAMLGFSIQNQVAAPFADPWQDASRMMSFAWWDRMNYAGKAMGQAVDTWSATGESPIRDARTRDLMMRAFAPKMLYRSTQAAQDSTLKSLTNGYPVAKGLSLSERMLWAAGGNPTWVEQRFDVARELWKDQDARRAAVTKYGKEWAGLIAERDYTGLKLLIRRALYEGVDISSLVKSGKAISAKGQEDMIERQFKPEEILKYREAGLYQQ